VNYTYVARRGAIAPAQIHALGAGITASVFLGSSKSEPAPAPVKAAEPPKPAPTPAAVSIALNPAQVTLGPGQTQQFAPSVSGSDNQAVSWSLSPSLGTLANGLYTAPAKIELPETVAVTATSLADQTKAASALVKLNPPAEAPQKVSMELKVLFDTGKDVIKPQFDAEIKQVADFLKTYPSARAEIEGHTDSMGSEQMNMALSQRRADSVMNYLVQKLGVDAARLTAKGYGPSKPVADNKTVEGRAKNRRVVATITATKS
jgi:OOP family OmpA-OmpF porin